MTIFNTRLSQLVVSRTEYMLRSSVFAELLVLIIIVTYVYVIPSNIFSFAQNSGDIRDNDSLRGSLLMFKKVLLTVVQQNRLIA